MAMKVERYDIDGDYYEVTQLGGVAGLGYFHELRKLALPALRSLLSDEALVAAFSGKVDLEQLDAKLAVKLVAVIFELFESMPKTLELELARVFAEKTMVQLQGADVRLPLATGGLQPGSLFDQHFAGRYGSYQKWLLACIKLNFAGFLGASGSSGSPANPLTASA
jgi:hypothetical protein